MIRVRKEKNLLGGDRNYGEEEETVSNALLELRIRQLRLPQEQPEMIMSHWHKVRRVHSYLSLTGQTH